MPFIYSNPKRELEEHGLPDVEIFYSDGEGFLGEEYPEAGWYFQFCFQGCLPDSDPFGPYETFDKAKAELRDMVDTDEGEE